MPELKDILHASRDLATPFYLIDVAKLRSNLEILRDFAQAAGAKIILAQKAFSNYAVYPLVAEYLSGSTASSLHEAKLAHEFMPGLENHIFSPAFRPEEWSEICSICDHIVFNSGAQLLS